MKLEEKIILLLIPVLLLTIVPLVVADYVQTEVLFNVAANTGFIVTLPGGTVGTNNSNSTPSQSGANQTTGQIEFNASGGSTSNVVPCVVAGACQTASQPIFNYTNLGNTNLTIGIFFNNSGSNITCGGSGNVSVIVNCTIKGYGTGCSGQPAVGLQESAITEVGQNLTPSNWSNYLHVWLWANFTSCSVAGQYRHFIFHRSNATS